MSEPAQSFGTNLCDDIIINHIVPCTTFATMTRLSISCRVGRNSIFDGANSMAWMLNCLARTVGDTLCQNIERLLNRASFASRMEYMQYFYEAWIYPFSFCDAEVRGLNDPQTAHMSGRTRLGGLQIAVTTALEATLDLFTTMRPSVARSRYTAAGWRLDITRVLALHIADRGIVDKVDLPDMTSPTRRLRDIENAAASICTDMSARLHRACVRLAQELETESPRGPFTCGSFFSPCVGRTRESAALVHAWNTYVTHTGASCKLDWFPDSMFQLAEAIGRCVQTDLTHLEDECIADCVTIIMLRQGSGTFLRNGSLRERLSLYAKRSQISIMSAK